MYNLNIARVKNNIKKWNSSYLSAELHLSQCRVLYPVPPPNAKLFKIINNTINTTVLKDILISISSKSPWRCGPTRAMASSFTRFLDHTQRRITVGRTPLDEWSARRRDFYLTTHDTHNRQTSMPPGGIRTHDLTRRAAAELRLRPRGHWGRLFQVISRRKYFKEICDRLAECP